jgi:hypothetical protein
MDSYVKSRERLVLDRHEVGELLPKFFSADDELPPGGFHGDEELPPGGFRA